MVGLQLPTSLPLSTAGWFAATRQPGWWLVVGLQLPPSHPHTAVCRQPGWWLVCSFQPPILPASHHHTAVHRQMVGGWFPATNLPPSYRSAQATWLVVGLQLPPSHSPTPTWLVVGGWFAASTIPPSYPHTGVCRQHGNLVGGWFLQLPPSHPHTAVCRQPGWWLVCSFQPPTLVPSYPSAQATWLVVGLQLPPSHPHTAVCRQPGWWLVSSFHPPTLQPSYCSAQATWLVVGLQLPPSHPHTAVCRQPGWWLVCSFQPPTLRPFDPPTLIPQCAGNLVGGWFAASTLPPSYHSVQATWLVVGLQLPTSNPQPLTLILQCTGNLVGGWFAASTLPPSNPHTAVCRQPG